MAWCPTIYLVFFFQLQIQPSITLSSVQQTITSVAIFRYPIAIPRLIVEITELYRAYLYFRSESFAFPRTWVHCIG